jgi:hypothetical protein
MDTPNTRSYTNFGPEKKLRHVSMFEQSCKHFLVNVTGDDKIGFICAAFNSITYKFWDKRNNVIQWGSF